MYIEIPNSAHLMLFYILHLEMFLWRTTGLGEKETSHNTQIWSLDHTPLISGGSKVTEGRLFVSPNLR